MSARPRITAAAAGVVVAGTLAAYVAGLQQPEPDLLNGELAASASEDPALAPLVKRACPSCSVTVECAMRADGNLCRYGRLYGPGLGGVNPDGSPATCAIRPEDKPWPCTGPDANWPETVRALLDDPMPAPPGGGPAESRDAAILRLIDERVKARPEPPQGGL